MPAGWCWFLLKASERAEYLLAWLGFDHDVRGRLVSWNQQRAGPCMSVFTLPSSDSEFRS
jgi:hypothetical protein